MTRKGDEACRIRTLLPSDASTAAREERERNAERRPCGDGVRSSALWGSGKRGTGSRSNALWGSGKRRTALLATLALVVLVPLGRLGQPHRKADAPQRRS